MSTVLKSVFAAGGRVARYGDFSIVYMSSGAFVTTPVELVMNQNWARARTTFGNPAKDRMAFVDRFETVLARVGCGIATKGSRGLLQRIVKSMVASALPLEQWSIPRNLNESMEMKKKPGPDGAKAAETDAGPATP